MNTARELIHPKGSIRSLFRTDYGARIVRGLLFSKLKQLKVGRIEILDPQDGKFVFGVADAPVHYRATVKIRRPRAYGRIAFGGSIGAGESYMETDWDCADLTALMRIMVGNREVLNSLDGGVGATLSWIQKTAHRLRSNTIQGARSNIRAHYDLGNDFFKLFLDETLTYSAGIFAQSSFTMAEASTEKYDRICRNLKLKPSDHLVEIGTGWGGFALHAAGRYGCRVTTTTISQEQFKLATERVREAGLSKLVTVLFEDYRKIEGEYDALVSIEMIEAVGLDHLPTYFKKCSSLLKPGGKMMLQAITIRDEYYEFAKRNVDFIQRHIFPGSGIPSIQAMKSIINEETPLSWGETFFFGTDYARTLRTWSENLKQKHSDLLALGYSDELYRMWQFYFSYCEGGFLEQSISCAQIELERSAK
jgi:cyclopropane-fatty-acyl-phospholipid synthase